MLNLANPFPTYVIWLPIARPTVKIQDQREEQLTS